MYCLKWNHTSHLTVGLISVSLSCPSVSLQTVFSVNQNKIQLQWICTASKVASETETRLAVNRNVSFNQHCWQLAVSQCCEWLNVLSIVWLLCTARQWRPTAPRCPLWPAFADDRMIPNWAYSWFCLGLTVLATLLEILLCDIAFLGRSER